jgi:Tol biopolymer transport system component
MKTGSWMRFIPCFLLACIACSSPVRRTGDYKIALVPSRSGQKGIFVMNADTTGGKLLTPDASAELQDTSWSPDGKKIAFFASRRQDSDLLSKYRIPYHSLLYAMDPGGGNQKRLLDFPVSSFEWSPDSREMLYVSAYEDPQHNDPAVLNGTRTPMSAVYVLNIKTGNQRRLTSFGQNCSGAWSPDGTQIALSFGTGKSSDIFVVSLDGKHARRLTDSKSVYIRPKWSPNGVAIAFVSIGVPDAGDPTPGAYVINADGTNLRRISDKQASKVIWAPDGKSLLLQAADGIVLTDSSAEWTRRLVPAIGRPLNAVFTPDGQEVIFRSNHEGEWHLYAVDLNSAHLRKITGRLSASTYCLSPKT